MSEHVWYACYGSNLLEQRFLCYIKGGKAPGGLLTNPGARDNTLPLDIRPYKIDRPLYFGENIPQWQGGGVGFLENNPVPDVYAYGRIYKITNEQFDDVVFQENGLKPGDSNKIIPRPETGQSCEVFDSIYGRVICLEEIEGSPVFTFTRPVDIPLNQRMFLPNIPSPDYGHIILFHWNSVFMEFGRPL